MQRLIGGWGSSAGRGRGWQAPARGAGPRRALPLALLALLVLPLVALAASPIFTNGQTADLVLGATDLTGGGGGVVV